MKPYLKIHLSGQKSFTTLQQRNNHHFRLSVPNSQVSRSKHRNGPSGEPALLAQLPGKLSRISSAETMLIVSHISRGKNGNAPAFRAMIISGPRWLDAPPSNRNLQ